MGAVVGGIVGGIFGGGIGGLLGGALNSITGGLVNKLVDAFGLDDVLQGVVNLAGDFLNKGINSLIDNSFLPDFLKDAAKDVVGNVIGSFQETISPEAQEAVDRNLGEGVSNYVDDIIESIKDELSGGEHRKESGGGREGGHWLIALAKAMGKVAGEQVERMEMLQNELADIDQEEEASEFIQKNAELTATSQLFKMTSESMNTVLKSLGEGLSAIARKQ